ncbi:hypothetical protein ACTVKL_22450, partial [Serratia marcescens]|uniref:hypothetical protein n=1 Tax=Serratia marcescens TaxID=615 RepID=UPI003FA7C646
PPRGGFFVFALPFLTSILLYARALNNCCPPTTGTILIFLSYLAVWLMLLCPEIACFSVSEPSRSEMPLALRAWKVKSKLSSGSSAADRSLAACQRHPSYTGAPEAAVERTCSLHHPLAAGWRRDQSPL